MKSFRIIVIISAFCAFGSSYAQVPDVVQPKEEVLSEAISSRSVNLSGYYARDESEILPILRSQLPRWERTDLKFIAKRTSILGTHYTFGQVLDGVLIENALVRAHADLHGKVILVQSTLFPEQTIYPDFPGQQILEPRWILTDQGYRKCERVISRDESHSYEYYYGSQMMHRVGATLFFMEPDTIVHARVFNINPLNSANKTYGAPYSDQGDNDVAELNAERIWVEVPARLDNGLFRLETSRYFFEDISAPNLPAIEQSSDTFDFTRAEDNFEDVNAFYHITAFSNYVESLGMSSQLPDTLLIDAHAFGGADRSGFTYNVDPWTLEFGEGGVDDAEDGEVVVHEFGHAVSFSSSPNTVSGNERRSMEEGNADYICKTYSYSKSNGSVHKDNIFSWDGHNEFWDGIETNVNLQYPIHISGNTNTDRAIWSTPLLCIRDKIGYETADPLIFAHLNFQTTNSTMPQMAQVLLMTDTLLHNGAHSSEIISCFAENGILESEEPKPPKEVKYLVLYNTRNFSVGKGDIRVFVPGDGIKRVVIFDALGRVLRDDEGIFYNLLLESQDFSKGSYFIHIEAKDYSETRRFIKLD